MPFALALILTLLSAACCNFSTARAEPRLPPLLGWTLGAAALVLAALVLALAQGMSTFTAILAALASWMILLPVIAVLRSLRALRQARAGRTHG